MAKFCTQCGKPLEEGIQCDCMAAQHIETSEQYHYNSEVGGNFQTKPSTDNISLLLKKILEVFKAVVKSPSTEGAKHIVSTDRNIVLGLIGAQALLSTLFAILIATRMKSLLRIVFLVGGSSKAPYIKIFFVTLLGSVALSFILAGIIFGICYLFKNRISMLTALRVVSVRSIALIPVTLVASVILFLNMGYGIALFFAGNLAGICYMVAAISGTNIINRDKVPVIVFLAAIVFGWISIYLMGKGMAIIAPDSLQGMPDSLTNPGDFFSGVLGGL